MLELGGMYMEWMEKLMRERYVRFAARVMQIACCLILLAYAVGLLLSLLGRQTFRLSTSTGVYEHAVCAATDPGADIDGITVSMDDSVYVRANAAGGVDLATQAALFLMYACKIVPLMAGYWLLSRVFANVFRGEIFTDRNARFLLLFGLIEGITAVAAPLLRLLLCALANLVSDSQVSVSTGSGMLSGLVWSMAFVVAAYILHYGIHLQDEVDHTL